MPTSEKRHNGFTCPLHRQQILSWLAYLIQIILYFTTIFPTFTKWERVGVSIGFCAIWLFYNIMFIRAAHERHVDPRVGPDYKKDSRPCRWCEANVKPGCKHCRWCAQCRKHFDHHCFFLNNCVTRANYYDFFLGIFFLAISSLFSTFLCVWVIMSIEYDSGRPLQRARDFYGYKVPKAVLYVFCGLHMFLMLGIQTFMAYLLALHFMLAKRGITTFQLIIWRRQQRTRDDAQKV